MCFVKLPKKLSPIFLSRNYLCFAGIYSTYYLLQVIQHLTKSLQIIPGSSQGGLRMCSWITTVSYQVVSINFFLICFGPLHWYLLLRLLLPAKKCGPDLSITSAAGELPQWALMPWGSAMAAGLSPCRASRFPAMLCPLPTLEAQDASLLFVWCFATHGSIRALIKAFGKK